MTNGLLGAGTYNLINGTAPLVVSGLTMTLNLPSTTRQTIALARPASGTSPGYLNLTVTGSAGSLVWSGSNGATWDLNTTADWSGASPATFYNLDTVTFNDSTTSGTVVLSGTLEPNVVNVTNNTTNYLLSGSGGLGGNTALVKSGSAALTIANTGNTFNGPIYLNGGTLYADAYLGSGTIYMNGGTLSLQNGTYLQNSIVVNTTSAINGDRNSNWVTDSATGNVSSTSPVTLYVTISSGGFLTFAGNMDGFQGTFEMGNSAGSVRFNGDGSGQALFDIGTSNAWFENRNGGVTVNFGGLAGGPQTTLGGRQSGSGATTSTYVVGALNTNTTFAGTVVTGGDLGGLNLTKVGTGNWTLSGTSSFTGNIIVDAGTLTISGSVNNNGLPFEVTNGAAFVLAGGTINTETVQIDNGAALTGYGTINAALTNQGTATVTGGALTVNGNFENDGTLTVGGSSSLVVNLPTDGSGSFVNNGTLTVDGSSSLVVNQPTGGSGSFVNNGLLDIMDSPQTVLPAGYVNNGTILTSSLVAVSQVSKSRNTFSVSIQSYTGHTYQLQESTDLTTAWQNVGAPQTGSTGSTLVLTDTNASSTSMFYRISVAP
jgi:autotransporter-associated beta strand protein